ncbi:hypothetical protein [Streptomyces chartreusis]|uniref:hypothetical protein n=1 Tax=Streptomyces chartreusis TaxID=1969 RepID=UPI00399AB163
MGAERRDSVIRELVCGRKTLCKPLVIGTLVMAVVAVGFGLYWFQLWKLWQGEMMEVVLPGVVAEPSPAEDRHVQPSRQHRWVVEQMISWLNGCRWPHRRHERKAERHLAFADLML